MARFKERSQGFIIGIMVGLIVAGGFFILKLDDYFKELNFYKSVAKSFSSETKEVEQSPSEVTESNLEGKQKKGKPKAKKAEESQNTGESPETPKSDTLSVVKDSLILGSPAGDEDIVIRKDEQLSTKTLEVINMDPVVKMTGKDSLLQKVSGIKDDKNSKQYFNIEFWSSPLNYKGYKMSKYKLVLYGVGSADGLKLFKLDDVIYMKSASLVYRLDNTGDFKPYERITDETVVNKLK
jgi:hypothetical protein